MAVSCSLLNSSLPCKYSRKNGTHSEKRSKLLQHGINYDHKKFYDTGPWRRLADFSMLIDPRGQYCEAFYDRNLRIFVIS